MNSKHLSSIIMRLILYFLIANTLDFIVYFSFLSLTISFFLIFISTILQWTKKKENKIRSNHPGVNVVHSLSSFTHHPLLFNIWFFFIFFYFFVFFSVYLYYINTCLLEFFHAFSQFLLLSQFFSTNVASANKIDSDEGVSVLNYVNCSLN